MDLTHRKRCRDCHWGLCKQEKLIPVRLLKENSLLPVWNFFIIWAKYQTPAQDRSQTHEKMDSFDKASRLLESSAILSELTLEVDEKDRENLQIWSCLTK